MKTEIEKMWMELKTGWIDVPVDRDGDIPSWKKSCAAAQFFLEPHEDDVGNYDFIVVSDTATVLKQSFKATTLTEAKWQADGLIGNFFKIGYETWIGRKVERDWPEGELRLKSIVTAEHQGAIHIYGIDEDGVLYALRGGQAGTWSRMSMKLER